MPDCFFQERGIVGDESMMSCQGSGFRGRRLADDLEGLREGQAEAFDKEMSVFS